MDKRIKAPYYVTASSVGWRPLPWYNVFCWQFSGSNKFSVLRAVVIDCEDPKVTLIVVHEIRAWRVKTHMKNVVILHLPDQNSKFILHFWILPWEAIPLKYICFPILSGSSIVVGFFPGHHLFDAQCLSPIYTCCLFIDKLQWPLFRPAMCAALAHMTALLTDRTR